MKAQRFGINGFSHKKFLLRAYYESDESELYGLSIAFLPKICC
jgi:hypothetical protein